MKVNITKKFTKDFAHIKNQKLRLKTKELIFQLQYSDNLIHSSKIKKMKGYDNYFRIKMGNHRVGIQLLNDEIYLIRILHRKDIYKYFPN